MSQKLNNVQKSSDFALGRNRNVVIHGNPELFMENWKRRDRVVRYHMISLLRTAEIPECVVIKRVLRLGRWQEASYSRCRDPRPKLAEFANSRHIGRFMTSADGISTITREVNVRQLDGTTVSKIKLMDCKGGLPGCNTLRLQVPKLRVQKSGEGG